MDQAGMSSQRRTPVGLAGWIGAAAFVAIVGGCMALGSGSGRTPSLDEQHRDAQRVCQDFVKERLKAPVTASFADVDTSGGAATGVAVTGSVDAENTFGAKVRSTFTCTVTLSGDNWRLDELTVR